MNLRSLLFTFLFFIPCFIFAGFNGDYRVKGINPDGSRYNGTLIIEKTAEGIYSLRWDIQNDGIYVGQGVQQRNSLAVSYDTDLGGAPGVISYKVRRNKLIGPFISIGDNEKGYELASKVCR